MSRQTPTGHGMPLLPEDYYREGSPEHRRDVFLPFIGGVPGSPPLHPSSPGGDLSVAGSYESEASFKLFVGCLPYEATEEDLRPLFEKFGDIVELTIQRDRSGFSKGCAWLRYSSKESCDEAISQLHGQFFIGSVRSPIQVKFAASEARPAHAVSSGRLLLTGIPLNLSESEVVACLSVYGEIAEFGNSPSPRSLGGGPGSAVIRFARPENAESLISAIRSGPLLLGGLPCFTLRALPFAVAPPSSASRTPPSFSSPTGDSPEPVRSIVNRTPHTINPVGNLPQELLTPAKLFIGCLPYSKSSSDLASLFGQYGPILEVALLVNPDGRSKGAAFVTFAKNLDAQEAQRKLNGYVFPNSTRPINVSFATNQSYRAGIGGSMGAAGSHQLNRPNWQGGLEAIGGGGMRFPPSYQSQPYIPPNFLHNPYQFGPSSVPQFNQPADTLDDESPTASSLQNLLAQIIGFDSPANRMQELSRPPPGFDP